MAEPVEVAIEKALLNRVIAYCVSPAIPLSLPNVTFTPPVAAPGVFYLRASFLPAETFALGVGYNSTHQHYGIFQVDVFAKLGEGEYPAGRQAAGLIAYFKRGTQMYQDGFTVNIIRAPSRGPLLKSDPWIQIPVNIPYIAFASNPA